jgi:spermidine/putrescine transport system substrate-binding protein
MKFQRSAAGRLFGTLLAGMAAAFLSAGADAQELNALGWCDHSDPEVLKPFEEANGVKVNVK